MKYSVPVIIETTHIYEVEARNGYEAAAKAGVRHADPEGKADHTHETKHSIGKILPTVDGAKLERVAGAAEHPEPDKTAPAPTDPRRRGA